MTHPFLVLFLRFAPDERNREGEWVANPASVRIPKRALHARRRIAFSVDESVGHRRGIVLVLTESFELCVDLAIRAFGHRKRA